MLIRYLCKKYNIKYLIGHYEYTAFKGTELWKETDPTYLTAKNDPSISFMCKIRFKLQDLKLSDQPISK